MQPWQRPDLGNSCRGPCLNVGKPKRAALPLQRRQLAMSKTRAHLSDPSSDQASIDCRHGVKSIRFTTPSESSAPCPQNGNMERKIYIPSLQAPTSLIFNDERWMPVHQERVSAYGGSRKRPKEVSSPILSKKLRHSAWRPADFSRTCHFAPHWLFGLFLICKVVY